MKIGVFYSLVLFAFSLLFASVAQDVSGYINIDCGATNEYNYSGLRYVTDAGFIDSGENHNILTNAYAYTYFPPQFTTLRSFPDGQRNCYNLSVTQGNKYLVRALFVYGNYDSKNKAPQFDLHLGVDKWVTVSLESNPNHEATEEIIHVATSKHLYVCLVKTGPGIPFISGLELRPLNTKAYPQNDQGSLRNVERWYFAIGNGTNLIRYPDDAYDRIWWLYKKKPNWQVITTTSVNNQSDYQLPKIVMQSAVEPATGMDLMIEWNGLGANLVYIYFFHFPCIETMGSNGVWEIDVNVNGAPAQPVKSVKLDFMETATLRVDTPRNSPSYNFTLQGSALLSYAPIISAVELYNVLYFLQSQTDENDVLAVANIKATYRLKKSNWQGDPCLPRDFLWEGLDCITFDNKSAPPRIKYLDLSWSGLSGTVTPYLSQLKSLEFLDLSHNNLSGAIPDFLAELPSLKVLNLTGNNFSWPVPQKLTDKEKNGLLLRIKDTKIKAVPWKKSLVKILALSLVALFISGAIALFIVYRNRGTRLIGYWKRKDVPMGTECDTADLTEKTDSVGQPLKKFTSAEIEEMTGLMNVGLSPGKKPDDNRRGELVICNRIEKEGSLGKRLRRFTYGEIEEMTKKFENPIGHGAFGVVFRGSMADGTEVAVKRLFSESAGTYNDFMAEVGLLDDASHPNLTPIFGYCHEDQRMAFVFKYMPNRSLNRFLSEDSEKDLTWLQRLNISLGAAKGLLYLHETHHHVHRDIKPENILLDENFEAKLADFGLAREIMENTTHVTTMIKGSHGYMDPEYDKTQQLRLESDVYSFGVVMLRLITGRSVWIEKDKSEKDKDEYIHITYWVKNSRPKDNLQEIVDQKMNGNFDEDDLKEIVDQKMNGNFDKDSAKQALNLAMECAHFKPANRPTMGKVVDELDKCLKLAETNEALQNL